MSRRSSGTHGRSGAAAGRSSAPRRREEGAPDGSPAPHPFPDRWDATATGGVFVLALAIRIVYLVQIHAAGIGSYLRLDPLYYHQWGQRIAAGDWLGTSVFEMSPLYAYILGVLYKSFGDGALAPQILQCLLAAIVCGLLAPVGRRAFGKAEGLIAGAAFAIYGPAVFYDGQVMKTSLEISFTSLMTFALFAASRGRGAPRPRWLFAGGVLLGLTALMRENILVAAPIFFMWALWPRPGRSWGKALVAAAALTAGTLLPILPFTVRNVVVGHELVLISSLGGENFYTGNNLIASGRYTPPPFVRPDPEYEHLDFRREAARRAGHPLTRREANAFWFHEGLKFITGHPVRYAALLWDKLAVFFNDFERPDNYSYYNFARFASLLRGPVLHFVWIAPLGLLGIALSWRRWGTLAPLLITLAAFLASALIFFTQSRYRMPAVPLLCLFGAHAAVALVASARAMRWITLAWSIPALVVLTLFVRTDPGNTPLFDAQNEALVAEMYLEAGRLDEAVASYRRSIDDLNALPMAGMPALGRVKANAHLGLARTLLRKGDRAEGIAELREAARSPRPEVRFNSLMLLGVLLGQDGDLRGSAEVFHRAVGENPKSFEARMMYAQALDRTGRRLEAIVQIDEALRIRPEDVEARRIRDALARGGGSR